MRRVLTAFSILAVLALGTVVLFEPAEAAFTVCTYKCICSVPHRCCTLNGVTTCTPDPNGPLQCTQVYNC